MKEYQTLHPHFLHGADYNPEQWSDTPEVWDEDMRLMKLAHVNSATVAIFAFAITVTEHMARTLSGFSESPTEMKYLILYFRRIPLCLLLFLHSRL